MKAYFVNDITITDPDLFKVYADRIRPVIERYAGKVIAAPARTNVTVIGGDWSPSKVIIIEWPSKEAAMNFVNDPDTQELWVIRDKSCTVKLIVVEDNYMPL